MTFDQLKFNSHPALSDAKQCRFQLPTGYTVSILSGIGLYGFQVAVFDLDRKFVRLSNDDDVLFYQTKDQVMEIIAKYSDKNNCQMS